MKLTLRDCLFIHDGLLVLRRNDAYAKKRDEITVVMKKFEGPNGMAIRSDQEVDFEEDWRNQLSELREKEAEVDEKIRKLQNYYLAFSKKSWQFIFGMIQVVLIFSMLGAVLYTISSIPAKLSVWAPIPIAFCLFLWEYSGRCFSGWIWRKKNE